MFWVIPLIKCTYSVTSKTKMATGFSNNAVILGDAMNFPESSSVRKKEALSNIIFKITQSTEKLNKRNERLLQLNLDYDLRMLQLARQREKITWEKLNCEKLCSSRTNKWLFETEDAQSTKDYNVNEGLALPRLSAKQTAFSTANIGQSVSSLRRVNTAPTILVTKNRKRSQKELKSVADLKYLAHSNFEKRRADILKSKMEIESKAINGVVEIEQLPEIERHNRVTWDNSVEMGANRRDEGGNVSVSERKIEKQLDGVRFGEIEKKKDEKHSEEELEKKEESYEKLLKRAEESTRMLVAYIPSGAVYRRLCATRKAYEDTEGKKPRILTRYLREKRAFENLSKLDDKSTLLVQAKEKTDKIVLSYI